MPEKLAIVTIDAGSNITGKDLLFPERVGTSSGKGTFADAIREVGGLAYDSGRAYRTITAAAMADNLAPDSSSFIDRLKDWESAGRFGHCAVGLSLDGIELPEHIVHGVEISRAVADFGAVQEVRSLTKRMKIAWLQDYVSRIGVGLVGFDGRAMREFVEQEVLSQVPSSELVAPFCMVVESSEAARRRMSQRKQITYDDPGWYLHPEVNATISELEERAKKDETRTEDPVGMPEDFYTYAQRGEEGLALSRLDQAHLDEYVREKRAILVDTTGADVDEVKRVGLEHILFCLKTLGGFNRQSKKLEQALSK